MIGEPENQTAPKTRESMKSRVIHCVHSSHSFHSLPQVPPGASPHMRERETERQRGEETRSAGAQGGSLPCSISSFLQ